MERVRVDWHIHTTLSPCGSLSMDSATIIESARLKGVDVIGITDHNSTRQGRLIKKEYSGSTPMILTGAEVTSREEIHCLVFFDDFETLDEFQKYLDDHLPEIPNNPDYFGDQVVVDADGTIVFEEQRLLFSAIDQTIDQIADFANQNGGIFIPAHINRPGYSLLSQLGLIPDGLKADALEWVPNCPGGLKILHDGLGIAYLMVQSSDAHRPEDIGRRYTDLEISDRSFKGIKEGLTRLRN